MKYMKILFVLFMTDFILTFIGINTKVIYEGNPLLVWLFELPMWQGLLLRIAMFALVFVAIKWASKHTVKPTNPSRGILGAFLQPYCKPIYIKAFYGFAFTANIGIIGVHIYWIIAYASMT